MCSASRLQSPRKQGNSAYAREQHECAISKSQFRVRRVARWAECDPAGVVYVGNFAAYRLSAVHLFRPQVFDADWEGMREQFQIDTPGKALSMVFKGSLWPDDVFDVEVRVGVVRTRTFDFRDRGQTHPGWHRRFRRQALGDLRQARDRCVSMRIPDPLRRRLQDVRASI